MLEVTVKVWGIMIHYDTLAVDRRGYCQLI